MDFNLYQEKAHETANYPSGTIGKEAHAVDYIYPALGLAEEAGEVAGKFAKAVRDNGGVFDYDRMTSVAKELGDDFAVANFVRYEKGEGLEKKEDNFAEEIAKLTQK